MTINGVFLFFFNGDIKFILWQTKKKAILIGMLQVFVLNKITAKWQEDGKVSNE